MITITYAHLLLTVLTLCAVVLTAAVVIGINRAQRLASRVDDVLTRLEPLIPELDRLSREAEETLRSVRAVSGAAGDIVRDVDRVTSAASRATLPLIDDIAAEAESVRNALRHVSAIAAGAKAGFAALARGRS